MNFKDPKDIIDSIKAFVIEGTDINRQILKSNHLMKKQVNYKLEAIYKKPIELKVLSTSVENI